MPIVPSQSLYVAPASAVTLSMYARYIKKDECAFWGVNRTATNHVECGHIWTKSERDLIAYWLNEAQRQLEREVGYFLAPTYTVGFISDEPNQDFMRVDSQDFYKWPFRMVARWGHLIEAGIESETTIEDNIAVTQNDPATFTTAATVPATITIYDIHVYHAGTDYEVDPSSITINNDLTVTVEIPRCRTVVPSLWDNPSDGLDYDDDANFMASAKLTYIVTDTSTNAIIKYQHNCNSSCASGGCVQSTKNGCIQIDDERSGIIQVKPSNYVNGQWVGTTCRIYGPMDVGLYYLSGSRQLDTVGESMIIKLAHAKMPEEPCECQEAQRYWKYDREVPAVITRERDHCPFGRSNGAWEAYRWAQAVRLLKAGIDA